MRLLAPILLSLPLAAIAASPSRSIDAFLAKDRAEAKRIAEERCQLAEVARGYADEAEKIVKTMVFDKQDADPTRFAEAALRSNAADKDALAKEADCREALDRYRSTTRGG